MPKDDFAKVQQQLETIASELKTATHSDRRKTLLREMRRLVAEAERITANPPKMGNQSGKP